MGDTIIGVQFGIANPDDILSRSVVEVITDKTYQAVLADQLSAAPKSSRLHDYYNVFTFPYDGINVLYNEICTFFT